MRYQLTLIKNPNHTYSFVGSVPLRLAYLDMAGNFVTAEKVESEMLLPAKYRSIKPRTFPSLEGALAAAKLIGVSDFEIKTGDQK